MRVCITGITGFVASHLADYILEKHPDVEIFGLKRWRSQRDNIRHIEDKLHLYDGDLHDLSVMLTIMNEIKPDWIFHLAAQTFVPISFFSPVDTLNTNVIGTTNFLESIRLLKLDPKIHLCSSSEVYGQPGESHTPTTEDCPLRPINPYGVSKAALDMLGEMYYRTFGLKIVRSRAYTHTGPRRGEPFVISSLSRQIAKIEKGLQEPIIKVGYIDSIRTFCDVRDMVKAYWLLLEKGSPGEVYNIGGNETMSIREALNILLSLSKISIKVEVDPMLLRLTDITKQVPDYSKFKALTRWEPTISFRKTADDLLNYWRSRV